MLLTARIGKIAISLFTGDAKVTGRAEYLKTTIDRYNKALHKVDVPYRN
jgi:hypothetical protein